METKHTNKKVLVEGLKKMGISLLCMFLGPSLIHIAFSNQEKPLYIPILILGILVAGCAVFFAFRGLKTILDSMFKN
ncbi:DUF6095 family protein [Mangrovimonas sp. AS39]|uniref:DUF6095 family protein n=1 Tax=Mangrovimonas TaxID=1211036 RepID=UPI00141FE673|nr:MULTISPECIES: DUF6095 family protein [Mangrovimonas]MCF1192599.1 DUF6095 family protein [Mangrovimonas futianensis]MCF1196480.1 DUF6095 family protein [Mangrovimonas futianensis]